jgi:hypothetical protein
VLVENLQVQLIRPPVTVRPGRRDPRSRARDCRAFALADALSHVVLPLSQFLLTGCSRSPGRASRSCWRDLSWAQGSRAAAENAVEWSAPPPLRHSSLGGRGPRRLTRRSARRPRPRAVAPTRTAEGDCLCSVSRVRLGRTRLRRRRAASPVASACRAGSRSGCHQRGASQPRVCVRGTDLPRTSRRLIPLVSWTLALRTRSSSFTSFRPLVGGSKRTGARGSPGSRRSSPFDAAHLPHGLQAFCKHRASAAMSPCSA